MAFQVDAFQTETSQPGLGAFQIDAPGTGFVEPDVIVLIGADVNTIMAREDIATVTPRADVAGLSVDEDIAIIRPRTDTDEIEP